MNLDVATPEKVASVLRQAAERYRISQMECQAAWSDKQAGAIWGRLATILDRAARQCEELS